MKTILICLLVCFSILSADWLSIGPYGGHIYATAISQTNPGVLYTAPYIKPCRIFRTTNAGADWLAAGTINSNITCLAVDPTNSNTVYACAIDSNIYKTVDAGAIWTEIPISLHLSTGVAIDPSNPDIVYVVGDKLVGTDFRMVVCKTTDGGTVWTNTIFDSTTGHGFSVAIDPVSPSVLYAGGYVNTETKFYKSTNREVPGPTSPVP